MRLLRRIVRGRGLGWRPDLPDRNDRMYGDLRMVRPTGELPAKIDLRPLCHPVRDQGQQNSCVGHGCAACFEVVSKQKDTAVDYDSSEAFIYYQARAIEGTENQDVGVMMRSGVKVCVSMGVPTEASFPYDEAVYDEPPPAEVVEQASHFQVTQYLRLRNWRLTELLNCLAEGYPFVFGLSLYESFESTDVATSGKVPVPRDGEALLGGHAMAGVGYDRDGKVFIIRNSWGDRWGDGGYCYVPFDYMTSRTDANDFWTLRAVE